MEKLVKGSVVVIPFPFSNLSTTKKRPALVLAELKQDIILSQITSKLNKDENSITITKKDFKQGKLNQESNIRPSKIFTADKKIIQYKIGEINENKQKEVKEQLKTIFSL